MAAMKELSILLEDARYIVAKYELEVNKPDSQIDYELLMDIRCEGFELLQGIAELS